MKRPGNPKFTSIGTRGKGPGRHEGCGGKAPDAVSFQLRLNDFFMAKDEPIAEVTKKTSPIWRN